MTDAPVKHRRHVRIAAAILAAIVAAAVIFTYLSYTAAFTPTDTVNLTAPRAGLVMEPGAKVKFLSLEPLLGPLPNLNLAGIDWVMRMQWGAPAKKPGAPFALDDARAAAATRALQLLHLIAGVSYY